MIHCSDSSARQIRAVSTYAVQPLRVHLVQSAKNEFDRRLATLDRLYQLSSWHEQRRHQAAESHLLGQVRSGQYARYSLADLLVRACDTWESGTRWSPDAMELAAMIAAWGRQHDPNDQVVAEFAARRAASDALLPYVGEAVGTTVTGQYRTGRGVVFKDGRTLLDPTAAEVLTPADCSRITDRLAALEKLSFEHPTSIDETEFRHHLFALDFTRPPVGCLFAVAEMISIDLLRYLNRSPSHRALGVGCGPATCQLLSALVPTVVQGCNPHLEGRLDQSNFDVVVINLLDRHLLGEQWDLVNNAPLLPRPLPMSLPSRKDWREYVEALALYGCSRLAAGELLVILSAPEEGTIHIAEQVLNTVTGMKPEWTLHPLERRGVWFPQMNQHPLLQRFGITQPKGRLLSFWRRG